MIRNVKDFLSDSVSLLPLNFRDFLYVDEEVVSRVEFFRPPLKSHVPAFHIAAYSEAVLHPLIFHKVINAAPLYSPVSCEFQRS